MIWLRDAAVVYAAGGGALTMVLTGGTVVAGGVGGATGAGGETVCGAGGTGFAGAAKPPSSL